MKGNWGRKILLGVSGAAIISGIVVDNNAYRYAGLSGVLMIIGLIGIVVFVIQTIFNYFVSKDLSRMDEATNERNEIYKKIVSKDNASRSELMFLFYADLQTYYYIGILNGQKAFALSLIAIVIGMVLIAVGICAAITKPEILSLGIITSIAGGVSEFIGITAISLYRESGKHNISIIDGISEQQKNIMNKNGGEVDDADK